MTGTLRKGMRREWGPSQRDARSSGGRPGVNTRKAACQREKGLETGKSSKSLSGGHRRRVGGTCVADCLKCVQSYGDDDNDKKWDTWSVRVDILVGSGAELHMCPLRFRT